MKNIPSLLHPFQILMPHRQLGLNLLFLSMLVLFLAEVGIISRDVVDNNALIILSCDNLSFKFYLRMKSNNSSSLYKNLTCASLALLIIFVTVIFVAKDFFDQTIEALVDDRTLLKDYHYPIWGQFPGNIKGDFTHTLSIYNHSSAGFKKEEAQNSHSSTSSVVFDYSFSYDKVSYGQGNQGFIRYLNHWKRSQRANQQPSSNQMITTLNLPAEKVYGYDYLATASRRFVVMYNQLKKAVKQMLPQVYATTLHKYYLHDREVVESAIFEPLKLSKELRETIYTHSQYGWNNAQQLQPWLALAHMDNRHSQPEWELLRSTIGLSEMQLQNLVGVDSVLRKLSLAYNGTIKYKLESNTYQYKDCKINCNDDQLMAAQFGIGLLSGQLFASVTLNKMINDFNSSIPAIVEYSAFCKSHLEDGMRCVAETNKLDLFLRDTFGNFTAMSQVFANRDNFKLIESIFGVKDPLEEDAYGQSIMAYIDFLQTSVFTAMGLNDQPDIESQKLMLPNHLPMTFIIDRLEETLSVELLTRALYHQITSLGLKCNDFFVNDPYKAFASLCDKPEFRLDTDIKALRNFVKAYLFIDREQFCKKTGMSYSQAGLFLRIDTTNSPLAQQIKTVSTDLAVKLECQTEICSSKELLAREWGGAKPILEMLPQPYFPKATENILDWDVNNYFNKVEPQFYIFANQRLSLEDSKQFTNSGPQSVRVVYGLMNHKVAADKGDQTSMAVVRYVQRLIIDSSYGGPMMTKSVEDLLQGYSAPGLDFKLKADSLIGGAPWLEQTASLIETEHKPILFSKVSTGIVEKDDLRKILEVEGNSKVGSQYVTYQSEYSEVNEFLSSGRQVFGTNMLGFHQDIGKEEVLAVYLDFLHRGILLQISDDSYQYEGVKTHRYSLKDISGRTDISTSQQTERTLSINSESYFLVEPTTGSTLAFNLKYTAFTKPSFLKLYYNGQENPEIPLFDMEVKFERHDLDSFIDLAEQKQILSIFYICMIVLAALSMVGVIVAAVMFRLKSKSKRDALVDTLISTEGTSSIKI